MPRSLRQEISRYWALPWPWSLTKWLIFATINYEHINAWMHWVQYYTKMNLYTCIVEIYCTLKKVTLAINKIIQVICFYENTKQNVYEGSCQQLWPGVGWNRWEFMKRGGPHNFWRFMGQRIYFFWYPTSKMHIDIMVWLYNGGKCFHAFRGGGGMSIFYAFEGGHENLYHHKTFQPAIHR